MIGAAVGAINRLEDADDARERARVAAVRRDQRLAWRALTTLRDVAARYGVAVGPALQVVEDRLLGVDDGALTAAVDTWLLPRPPRRPRRLDLDAFAAIIRALHEADAWPVLRASRAVAALVDRVWADDPRSREPRLARRLWGRCFSETRAARVEQLAEALRQRCKRG